jgi:hypothetical protein
MEQAQLKAEQRRLNGLLQPLEDQVDAQDFQQHLVSLWN